MSTSGCRRRTAAKNGSSIGAPEGLISIVKACPVSRESNDQRLLRRWIPLARGPQSTAVSLLHTWAVAMVAAERGEQVLDMSSDAWAEVGRLLDLQAGVISRRQALRAGLRDHDVRRMLRRREWAVVHLGVYVSHTGPLTWQQRAWAAVLSVEPAALGRQSAIAAAHKAEPDGPLHIVADRDRAVRVPDGVVLHRLTGWESRVLLNTSPPRERLEEAVLDVASSASRELDVIAALADAVGARLTTAERLRTALDARARIPRRPFLQSLLDDVAAGTCSTLEHAYLDRVERAHGLPTADRQVRSSAKGTLYRDVEYARHLFLVELDGRIGHSSTADRDRDLDRSDHPLSLVSRGVARWFARTT